MNKQIYTSLFAILITCANTFANDKYYYYKSPLSLTLIKDGVQSFLEQTEKSTEKEMALALHQTISLAHKNQTDTKALLEDLKSTLNYRIGRIEYQLEHKHSFNRQDLITGAAWIGAGLGLCALAYFGYEKFLKPGYSEFDRIKNETESLGTKVVVDHLKRTIDVVPRESAMLKRPDPEIIQQKMDQLVILYNKNAEKFRWLFASGGTLVTIPICIGTYKIYSSFNPNADNQNLDKYKFLSKLVDALQKEQK